MRILATQETDWLARNPIVHHRLLEWLSTHGADVTVIDYDIDWAKRSGPVVEPRREIKGVHKYFADSRVVVVRPAMLRWRPLARLSWLLGNVRELRRLFRREPPDVLVGYGISNALLTLIVARLAGRRFVYHVMDALHTHADGAVARGGRQVHGRTRAGQRLLQAPAPLLQRRAAQVLVAQRQQIPHDQ